VILLPAISQDERAYLQSLQPGSTLQALAGRLRQRLVGTLGVQQVCVSGLPGRGSPAGNTCSGEPEIRIDNALATAWLGARFGGGPGNASLQFKDHVLVNPLQLLIRRTLAEVVINLGDDAWPAAIRLQVDLCGHRGHAEIFWNSGQALSWAGRTLGGKP
jgi:hypothetical protein